MTQPFAAAWRKIWDADTGVLPVISDWPDLAPSPAGGTIAGGIWSIPANQQFRTNTTINRSCYVRMNPTADNASGYHSVLYVADGVKLGIIVVRTGGISYSLDGSTFVVLWNGTLSGAQHAILCNLLADGKVAVYVDDVLVGTTPGSLASPALLGGIFSTLAGQVSCLAIAETVVTSGPPPPPPPPKTPTPIFYTGAGRLRQTQQGGGALGVGWRPRIIDSVWGYYQILVGGVDVTYYRDVVTRPSRLTWAEPFGAATAELNFPQITPFEWKPGWMFWGAHVNVWHVDANFQRVGEFPMWEGLLVATAASSDESTYGLTASCIGAMFQLDFYKKKPDIGRGWKNTDIGISIPDEINQITRQNAAKMYHCFPQNTGILTRSRGGWDPLLTGWIQDLLATATTEDSNQWTMSCDGRAPAMHLKDMTTIHWAVMNATPGVSVNLEEDVTQTKNVFYGEGVDDENCRWRNQKFPYLRNGATPIFPGRIISLGVSGQDVVEWKDEMRRSGYGMTEGSTYSSDDRDLCMWMQSRAGIQVDGVVGPQTWAATFESESLVEDPTYAIFLPMAWSIQAEPHLYNAGGSPLGPNPNFDPNILRLEEYQNLGDRISFEEGARSFLQQWNRDVYTKLAGTITLSVDPESGSRWDIRAGKNILVRQYQGRDVRLHIAGCDADLDQGTVTLTVDEKNRDLMTLAAVLERKRDTVDPVKRDVSYFRSSRIIPDKMSTWDCENGSGQYPRQGTYNGLWNITRIPMSEGGNIVRTRFTLDIASPFSVAVFDRPITANTLAAIGNPLDPGFYELAESGFDSDALGCLIAWGQEGDAAGYYPNREGDENLPLPTGVLQDDGSWQFSSLYPPWVWVAVWVQEPKINYIQGRFYLSVTEE